MLAALLVSLAAVLLAAPTSFGAVLSKGVYRIPYATGTTVSVSRDHLTHDPVTRLDLKGKAGIPPYRIAAAADGVIRRIQDGFSANRPDQSPCNNNYVWIEHPSGEWTKYSHMTKGSVRGDAGLTVGQSVKAGTFLGFEDDVGCAHGVHLHFEVAVPIDPSDPIDSAGFIRGGSTQNRIPWFCGVSGHVLRAGTQHVAKRCEPLMPEPARIDFGVVPVGSLAARAVDISNSSGVNLRVTFPASTTGAFRWPSFDRVIPRGERSSVIVQYRPYTSLMASGTLTINSAAPGSPHHVALTGRGCASLGCLVG
jgi:hypothetical protein